MQRLSPLALWKNLLWSGAFLIGCALATLIIRVMGSLVMAYTAGLSVQWSDLAGVLFNQIDLYLPLLVTAFLAIELVQNGWDKSALHRLLRNENASTRTDLFYSAAELTRLT